MKELIQIGSISARLNKDIDGRPINYCIFNSQDQKIAHITNPSGLLYIANTRYYGVVALDIEELKSLAKMIIDCQAEFLNKKALSN